MTYKSTVVKYINPKLLTTSTGCTASIIARVAARAEW